MVVEVLYPEFITYGEIETVHYLDLIAKEQKHLEIIKTFYHDEPYFVNNKVDLLFFGPMTERNMERVYKKLLPYRDLLLKLIDDGIKLLAINNILDLLGSELEVIDGEAANCLGLFPYKTVRDFSKRTSQQILFEFEGELAYGGKLGFSNYYGNESNYLYKSLHPEIGFNLESPLGGYKYKNSYLIELSENILMTNPCFLNLLKNLLEVDTELPFESDLKHIYSENLRLLKKAKGFGQYF